MSKLEIGTKECSIKQKTNVDLFKEGYDKLRENDKSISPIIDFVKNENGDGRLNIVFYDAASYTEHSIDYRKFVSMCHTIKYISKLNNQNYICIFKSQDIDDKDILTKIRDLNTMYLSADTKNEIYWYSINNSFFLSKKDFPFVHQKMIETDEEFLSEVSMSLSKDKFIKPFYHGLNHECLILIVGCNNYGFSKLYVALDEYIRKELKI